MVLVADSGSTKIDWALIDRNKKVSSFISRGCNPYFMTEKQIFSLFCLVRNNMPSSNIEKIFFYGAGCTGGEKNEMIENALHAAFGEKCKTEVQSDMLGAARALCGRKEGIACILGTGSNSCLRSDLFSETKAVEHIWENSLWAISSKASAPTTLEKNS